MRLIVAAVAALAVLAGVAATSSNTEGPTTFNGSVGINGQLAVNPGIQPQTGLPADAIVTLGNIRIDQGELQYGNYVTVPVGRSASKDYVAGLLPNTDVVATVQSGSRHLYVQSARVVQDEFVVIRLSGVAHVSTRVAFLLFQTG